MLLFLSSSGHFFYKIMLKNKPKQYSQVFLNSYTNEFPCIVKSHKGATFAFCSVCTCNISISHGGLNDVKVHIKSNKHHNCVKSADKNLTIGTFRLRFRHKLY